MLPSSTPYPPCPVRSKQEAFDHVWVTLTMQGRPAIVLQPDRNPAARCVFQTEDGRRCAAGALAPTDMGGLADERCGAYGVTMSQGAAYWGVDTDFVEALQVCHDYAALRETEDTADPYSAGEWLETPRDGLDWLKDFQRRMRLLAAKHGLSIPPEIHPTEDADQA